MGAILKVIVVCLAALKLLVACASNQLKGTVIDRHRYVPPIGEATCTIPGGIEYGEIHEAAEAHGLTVFLIDREAGGYRLDIHEYSGVQPTSDQELVIKLKKYFHEVEWPYVRSNVPGGQLVDEKPILINGRQVYYGLLYYPEVGKSLFNMFTSRGPFFSAIMVTLKDNYFYSMVTANPIRQRRSEASLSDQFSDALKQAKRDFRKCEIGVAHKPKPNCHSVEMAVKPRIRVWPVYPEEAIKQCIEGEISIQAKVDYSGKPHKVQVIGGDRSGVFDDAIQTAIKEWRFLPLCDNQAKEQRTFQQTLNFSLTDEQKAACSSSAESQTKQDD